MIPLEELRANVHVMVHPTQGTESENPLGNLPNVGASQTGPGTGSSYQPKGGSFYLNVAATGDWTVTVVQLP